MKNIPATPEQWEHIDTDREARGISAAQLVVEVATEPLDCHEWPSSGAEIHIERVAMFTAPILECDLISVDREVEELVKNMRALQDSLIGATHRTATTGTATSGS